MKPSIPEVLRSANGAKPPVGIKSNPAVAAMNAGPNGGLHQGCLRLHGALLRPALLRRLLLRPALLRWGLTPALWRWLLLPLLLGWLWGWLLNGCRRLRCLALSQRPSYGCDGFGQRCCFFCSRRRNEFREADNAVSIRVGLCVKGCGFLDGRAGSLSQFFHVQGSTAVLIGRNEMLSCTDELSVVV